MRRVSRVAIMPSFCVGSAFCLRRAEYRMNSVRESI